MMRNPDDRTENEKDNVVRFPVRIEHIQRELGAIADELRHAIDAREAPLTNPRAVEMMGNLERFRLREDPESVPALETIRARFLLWHPNVRAQKRGNLEALLGRAERMANGTRSTLANWRERQDPDPEQIERVAVAVDAYLESVRARIAELDELASWETSYPSQLDDAGTDPAALRITTDRLEAAIHTLTAERFTSIEARQEERIAILTEKISRYAEHLRRTRALLGE